MSLGLYISVPFCRSKCTFCNFASDVFAREKMSWYISRIRQEIESSEALALGLGARFERSVDAIYLGGGTPTTLAPDQISQIFEIVAQNFDVLPAAEITVECAPGTLQPEVLNALLRCGVNRISLGTQSFVDREIRSVGRLHTAQQTRTDIALLQGNGVENLNVDLIAGLPYQSRESWRTSLEELVACGVPHASVYLLEVDDDSRLGRELIAGGTRYHAHHVPDSDIDADLYTDAVEFLGSAGLRQYEISNFAQASCESRHNLKYWTRRPYLGFGLDAHSMLPAEEPSPQLESVRFSNTDDLELYLAGSARPSMTSVSPAQAGEELIFLGLRMNAGIDLGALQSDSLAALESDISELVELRLLRRDGQYLRLTDRGRLLSNEVLERFIAKAATA
jgi:oxygen-independent coproporphyrinogen-3 oxidase